MIDVPRTETISDRFNSSEFEEKWKNYLKNWKKTYLASPEQYEELYEWTEKLKLEFLSILYQDIDSKIKTQILQLKYIELKSIYLYLNLRIDSVVQKGEKASPPIYAKLVILEYFLDSLEDFISLDELDSLNKQLHSKVYVSNVNQDVSKSLENPDYFQSEILSNVDAMNAQLASLYKEKEYLEDHLQMSNAEDIIQIFKDLESQLIELYKEKENSIFINENQITIHGPKTIRIKKLG